MRDVRGWIVAAVLGVSSLLLPGGLTAGETKPTTTSTDFVRRMAADGWKEVSPGVLERNREGKKTDVMAYGKPGLEWALIQAKNRLGFFLREYRHNPTPDGAKALVEQNEEVKRLERALATAPTKSATDYDAFLNASCDFSYGVTVDAYPLTSSQGVGAQANAYFNNSSCSGGSNCGYTAEISAYAYVTARTGITTTTKFQRDPESGVKSGASVSATGSLTLNGTNDCYSEAQASATVPVLGLYLSAYDSHSGCPEVPPPTVSAINGLTYFYLTGYQCQTGYYSVSVSGGTPGYTYKWYWDGVQVGTGSSYSRTICGNNWYDYYSQNLSVTVTDSASRTASANTDIFVETVPSGGGCREPYYETPYPQYPIQDFPVC